MIRRIFPTSMLNPTKVDEAFETEHYQSSQHIEPVLYNSEKNKVITLWENIENETVLYRGWILNSSEYAQLELAVQKAGAKLLVTTDEYNRSQFMTGWLPVFHKHTAISRILPYSATQTEIEQALYEISNSAHVSQFVIKGMSKSLKHDWENSMFIKGVAESARVVNNFRGQVSEAEEPMIVFRAFENFDKSWGELRLWFQDDQLSLTSYHPQSEVVREISEVENDPAFQNFVKSILSDVCRLDASFITVDAARRETGDWCVVEVGSGCVSESSLPLSEVL